MALASWEKIRDVGGIQHPPTSSKLQEQNPGAFLICFFSYLLRLGQIFYTVLVCFVCLYKFRDFFTFVFLGSK